MGLTFPLSEPRSLKSLFCSWNEEIKNPVYLNVTLSDKDRWLNALLTRLAISATGACLFLVKWGWTIRRDDRYRSCCTKWASLTWNVICSFRRCRMAQRKKTSVSSCAPERLSKFLLQFVMAAELGWFAWETDDKWALSAGMRSSLAIYRKLIKCDVSAAVKLAKRVQSGLNNEFRWMITD